MISNTLTRRGSGLKTQDWRRRLYKETQDWRRRLYKDWWQALKKKHSDMSNNSSWEAENQLQKYFFQKKIWVVNHLCLSSQIRCTNMRKWWGQVGEG